MNSSKIASHDENDIECIFSLKFSQDTHSRSSFPVVIFGFEHESGFCLDTICGTIVVCFTEKRVSFEFSQKFLRFRVRGNVLSHDRIL